MSDGHTMHPHGASLEHLRRRCDGGTSRLDNLALACVQCNNGRGSMNWLVYTSLKRGEITSAEAALLTAA